MRLIKKGVPPKERIWEGTCGACGSIFEASEGELKVQHVQRDGAFATETCSICYSKMWFYPRK